MFSRFASFVRQHLIAFIALFIILGGSAVALPGTKSVEKDDFAKGAVTKKAIKKNAVTKKAIKANAVTSDKIADGAVTTGKLGGDAVTGAKADEASFRGLVEGDGRQSTRSFTAPAVGFLPEPIILATVPTMGVVDFIACFPDSPSGASDIRVRVLSFDDSQPFFGAGTVIGTATPQGAAPDGQVVEQTAGPFGSGGGSPLRAESPDPNNAGLGVAGWWDFTLSRGTGNDTVGAHVTVNGFNTSTAGTPNGECTVTATVDYQD